jgi:hypothetical protein
MHAILVKLSAVCIGLRKSELLCYVSCILSLLEVIASILQIVIHFV